MLICFSTCCLTEFAGTVEVSGLPPGILVSRAAPIAAAEAGPGEEPVPVEEASASTRDPSSAGGGVLATDAGQLVVAADALSPDCLQQFGLFFCFSLHSCERHLREILRHTGPTPLAYPSFPYFCTVSQKNTPDIIDCNLKTNYQILIIFGKNISDTTCHQTTIQLPISPNVCFCTTWGKCNQRNITFLSNAI